MIPISVSSLLDLSPKIEWGRLRSRSWELLKLNEDRLYFVSSLCCLSFLQNNPFNWVVNKDIDKLFVNNLWMIHNFQPFRFYIMFVRRDLKRVITSSIYLQINYLTNIIFYLHNTPTPGRTFFLKSSPRPSYLFCIYQTISLLLKQSFFNVSIVETFLPLRGSLLKDPSPFDKTQEVCVLKTFNDRYRGRI